MEYPKVKRDEKVVDDYHGIYVKDPYRWLEETESEEVTKFTSEQSNLTNSYLQKCVHKEKIRKKLELTFDTRNEGCPIKKGNKYYSLISFGLENHPAVYFREGLKGKPQKFFDPNVLSDDGSISLTGYKFSHNGETFAFGISDSGSDWITIKFMYVNSKKILSDELTRVKYSVIFWSPDSLGIFYAAYFDHDGTNEDSIPLSNQRLYYHSLGTPQWKDKVMAEFPNNPRLRMYSNPKVSHCGKYVFLTPRAGSENNLFYFAKLEFQRYGVPKRLNLVPVVTKFEAIFVYVATYMGSNCIFKTNKNAPNYKLILINLNKPNESEWKTLIPEDPQSVLSKAKVVNEDKAIIARTIDVTDTLELWSLKDGSMLLKFPLELGSIVDWSGGRTTGEFFFKFESFLTPGRIYSINFNQESPEAKLFVDLAVGNCNCENFVVKQVFYSSKDKERIPMFIIHPGNARLKGNSFCLLQGYGGFGATIKPSFSEKRLTFMEIFNGVVAIANIRGGGEYGDSWRYDGTGRNKQVGLDDFHAAAEYLISHNYTKPGKLIINGSSNGGLLVAACMNQRPELYGCVIAHMGVMDMLRFHKFQIGHAWVTEYGSSEDPLDFEALIKYSPLHNVNLPLKEDVQYPPVLLITGDNDDRVSPLHSYKFIAELQHTIGSSPRQKNPFLLRVDTNTGHLTKRKPVFKIIDELVAIFSFIVESKDLEIQYKGISEKIEIDKASLAKYDARNSTQAGSSNSFKSSQDLKTIDELKVPDS